MRISLFVPEDKEDLLMCSLERHSYTALDTSRDINLKSTFYLKANNYVLEEDEDTVTFTIGYLTNSKNFFELDKDVFSIENSIFIHQSLINHINHKHLVNNGRISILRRLSELISSNIFIAPDEYVELNESDMLLPWSKFIELVNRFPKRTELTHYANTRISNIVKDYLDLNKDYDEVLERYLSKKEMRMKDGIDDDRILLTTILMSRLPKVK